MPFKLPELVVDLFSGAGGASLGIKLALGRSPDVVVDHDQHASAVHEANHPQTRHLCQDVLTVDPRTICDRPVGLLWSSPDCTFFSTARSNLPASSKVRGLAWVVVHWAQQVSPRVIILENVRGFKSWGPLDAQGRPIQERKGETFTQWVDQLRAAGYVVEWRMLKASDYGTPTTRERLFVIARKDDRPIIWPEPQGDPIGAHTCIDWSILGRLVMPTRAVKTLERFEKGNARYIVGSDRPYIREIDGRLVGVWIASHYGGNVGRSLWDPLPTVTKQDHNGLVTTELVGDPLGSVVHEGQTYRLGDTYHRMLDPHELALAQGFPPTYKISGTKTARSARVGNAVCPPVAAALVGANYAPE